MSPTKPLPGTPAAARWTPRGNVTFSEQEDNTLVHVIMQWASPPGGPIGEAVSRILQDPEKMLREDLQRFKDIVEARIGSGLRR
jgi:uncharacterized membrane protein